jgi:hypothetical protein
VFVQSHGVCPSRTPGSLPGQQLVGCLDARTSSCPEHTRTQLIGTPAPERCLTSARQPVCSHGDATVCGHASLAFQCKGCSCPDCLPIPSPPSSGRHARAHTHTHAHTLFLSPRTRVRAHTYAQAALLATLLHWLPAALAAPGRAGGEVLSLVAGPLPSPSASSSTGSGAAGGALLAGAVAAREYGVLVGGLRCVLAALPLVTAGLLRWEEATTLAGPPVGGVAGLLGSSGGGHDSACAAPPSGTVEVDCGALLHLAALAPPDAAYAAQQVGHCWTRAEMTRRSQLSLHDVNCTSRHSLLKSLRTRDQATWTRTRRSLGSRY